MKTRITIVLIFIFYSISQFISGQENTLVRILESLPTEKGIINARRYYDTAILDEKYNYLQWWNPRIIIDNDLMYPYKEDAFDDLATSNMTSLSLALPFDGGTTVNLSTGYGIDRNMTDSLIWGFSQRLQGKIGVEQSLNPWWLHTRNNPYESNAALQVKMAMTEYNIAIKNALYSSVRAYIELRKAERNMRMLIEKIAFFDEITASYRQNLTDGIISMSDFQDLRNDKWEQEQALFPLEQNMSALKNELFQNTGIEIGEISKEKLIAIDDKFWNTIFLGASKNDIVRLEQNNIELQKTALVYERLINNQNSAPSIIFEFGSSILLPVQETDNLNDAWKEKHFTDNELNNWNMRVSINFSNLLSPANKRRQLEQEITELSLYTLSAKINAEKKIEKNQNAEIIRLLETHINQLSQIVENDNMLNEDMKILHEQGQLSELEWRQTSISNTEKRILLDNFKDDLWLHLFLREFLYVNER